MTTSSFPLISCSFHEVCWKISTVVFGSQCDICAIGAPVITSCQIAVFLQTHLAEEIDKLRSELDQFRLRAGSLTEPTLSRYDGAVLLCVCVFVSSDL